MGGGDVGGDRVSSMANKPEPSGPLFLYADDDRQYFYSITRQAVGEYLKGRSRWIFAGWLWEGTIDSVELAKRELTGYLAPYTKESAE
jgi:hypothetical protein